MIAQPEPEPSKNRLRSSSGRDTSRSLRDTANKRAILKITPQRLCASCHFSCLTCTGPSDSECKACAPDAVLNNRSNTEAFCLEKVPINNTNEQLTTDGQRKLLLPVVAVILTSIGLIVAIVWSVLRLTKKTKDQNYAYDRIAFAGNAEQIIIDEDILYESSASDVD